MKLNLINGNNTAEQMNEVFNNYAKSSIGEIVRDDFRTAEVFKKYKLDFCCGGKKNLAIACDEKRIDLTSVQRDLYDMQVRESPSGHNFNQWSIEFLTDYIVNTHHAYVKNSIPVLLEFTRKVARVHGDTHPEVVHIAEHFFAAAEELIDHMHKEEHILFPYIKKLSEFRKQNAEPDIPPFGTIQNPIHMMEHEHETVGDLFKNIRRLSDDYNAPEGACTTYRVSFLKLKEFEEDLQRHIHLENNILFPKSIQLENALNRETV